MILADDSTVSSKYLPIRISEGGPLAVPQQPSDGEWHVQLPPKGTSLYDIERELIQLALNNSHGNKSNAAKLLRISRDTLRYKVKKYNLE